MDLQDRIRKTMKAKDDNSKRLVTFNLDAALLDKIDKVAEGFSQVQKSKNFTRIALVEEALNAYVETAEKLLLEEEGIDINNLANDKNIDKYFDLAIFPARNEGFKEAFIKEKAWYAVKMNSNRIPKIKFVACYRAAPISGITHYAKVKEIRQYKNTDKKIVIFDGSPIELPQTVALGDVSAASMRSPRYTTLEKLMNSNTIKELFDEEND
jgi:hypothetical protein